ncbi:hypothetical protein [Niveibacterium sp. SC-1]|uniref:hypothetical protein n=1 Tax=Niveibacterium sp. SC-1 TaxID=3135646 RepID=UPI00311D89A9
MLSLRDCLDYCDLTEDDVSLLAEHEHLPPEMAAHIACALAQTRDGVQILSHIMQDLIERAERAGAADRAQHVRHVCARFQAAHQLAH